MLAFVRDGAGISATGTGGGGGSGGAPGSEGGGDGKAMGGVLEIDPELLSALEEKGTEALVVAFVEGGDVGSIPGWTEATKGLQGEVSECSGRRPWLSALRPTRAGRWRFLFMGLAEHPPLAFLRRLCNFTNINRITERQAGIHCSSFETKEDAINCFLRP